MQPARQMDGMQVLAIMMVVMVLAEVPGKKSHPDPHGDPCQEGVDLVEGGSEDGYHLIQQGSCGQ